MTRAMLLCAGLSTRLGDMSIELPKPLLPVCDIPVVRFGIAKLVAHDIRDIVINLHHHGELIQRELGDGSALGARIQYTHESTLLGTGGGLKNALSLLDPDGTDEPFISMNGKLIFDIDLSALVEAFAGEPDALGMMAVRKVDDARTWGAVDVVEEGDGRAHVTNVLDEGEHMFCGVHITRPSVMRRLPDGQACSIRQGYLPWMKAGERVAAHVVDSDRYFAEHSTPERYLESNIALLSRRTLPDAPADLIGLATTAHVASTARIRHPVRVGAGAHIGDGAQVGPHAVIGTHAVIEPGAVVERTVVWPGGRARGEVRNAIVTPRVTKQLAAD